jgi:glycosyltransferase involved in cell wall biosynthesis
MPTYNRVRALELSLEGFRRQSVIDFEVIVADDGSTQSTKNFLRENKDSYPFPLKHVWQEDKGFRKARISNMAIAKAESEYIIFSDADCIPRKDFVKAHITNRQKGYFLVGRSVKMSKKISSLVDAPYIKSGKLDSFNFKIFYDYLFGKTRFWEYSIYVKSDTLMKLIQKFKKSKSVFGYNFSAWKDDLVKINGFNEEFIYPNNEDGELGHRLNNIGLKPRLVICRAISHHYHHDRSHVSRREENIQRSAAALKYGLTRCEKGLDRHLINKD